MASIDYAVYRDFDYVVCECSSEALTAFVETLEQAHQVEIVKKPSVCLAMLRAQDSLENQEFYLGEVLVTECEVLVDGEQGFGLCSGDEPRRCYCAAVLDALRERNLPEINSFIDAQRDLIAEREEREFEHTARTHVDFKLMEES